MFWGSWLLIALPWLIFSAITVLYTVLYHHYREVTASRSAVDDMHRGTSVSGGSLHALFSPKHSA